MRNAYAQDYITTVNCVTSDSIDLMQIVKTLEIHLGQRCLVIL